MLPLKDNVPTRRTPVVTLALIAANLAVALFEHGGITTTTARAKALRAEARADVADLVARDADDYVRIAAESVGRILPSSAPRTTQARELEAAYRQLWEKRLGSRLE